MLLIGVLFFLSLFSLFVVAGTSFLKISVVLSLLRNALGIQQIPPNMALYGMALILSIFIMAPVMYQVSNNLQESSLTFETENLFERVDNEVITPYKSFLEKHASQNQVDFFSNTAMQLWPEEMNVVPSNSIFIMLPAFMVSQLIDAFKIGLLLYLPFIAIDLIVSNVLLAMGMMMVSPMTISLPFKILLFVMINGWERVLSQLILSYQ
ncbi:EscR/YscR/HrcR family type III secretion system export apparatus protein [Salmonella enterica subsp. enterica]|nr:EscR/YscR/HrcR family type III secretion system export apparatus protein [Salmonella enterica subsp. enterica serovar Bonn]EBZ5939323.1 EscR/YscR/HrcR family type III secretion system export apparatus protein [Salmonella enterica subsp. enterica serovar Muenchen]MLZ41066.1 EscR/YscR/HrcR family type III secretion system export apparatus protein [Salmonella enterica subsp. enterica serovar Bonn]